MSTVTSAIPVQRTSKSRLKETDFNNLEFGKYIADHMLVADFKNGKWNDPEIVPFGDITVSPAMLSLHYGQSIFEGMKAFWMNDGNINIFRPHKHHARLNRSMDRMCMPPISEEMFLQSLHALVELDKDWIPKAEGSSLYIRPLVFAYEARLGVKVADHFKFIIMNSPVAAYQAKPYRLKVENTYVRTAEGGTGFAKCAGNYGGAFYPTQVAREEGFDQILWTDHKEHKYIDEVGMMNVFFVIDGKLVTPKLTTAILEGVTRDTIITLARDMGARPAPWRAGGPTADPGSGSSSATPGRTPHGHTRWSRRRSRRAGSRRTPTRPSTPTTRPGRRRSGSASPTRRTCGGS
jgi:branched-chain amino acid aminotransferase